MLGSLDTGDLTSRFRVIMCVVWRLDTSVLDSVSLCQPVINMTTSDRWQCWHHSHLVLSTWYTLSAGTYKYSITKSAQQFDQADSHQHRCHVLTK